MIRKTSLLKISMLQFSEIYLIITYFLQAITDGLLSRDRAINFAINLTMHKKEENLLTLFTLKIDDCS